MKKYAFTLLTIAIVLSSCSKDNSTPEPEPFKITRISCTKNGSSADGFSMKIIYDTDKRVKDITYGDGTIDNYRYRANEIYVFNSAEEENITYTLSGEQIKIYELENPNPPYLYDKFVYDYSLGYLRTVTMSGKRIINNEVTEYQSNIDHTFEWTNRNMTSYNAGNQILEIDYTDKPHPSNFPFRILNTIGLEEGDLNGQLIQQENFNPLNFLLGYNNRNLIESARWYKNPNIDVTLGEYDFDYTFDSNGYVKNVIITETIHNGQTEENQYIVNFTYEDNPNK